MILKTGTIRAAKDINYDEAGPRHHGGALTRLVDYGTAADGPDHTALSRRAYNRATTGVIREINAAAKA